MIEYVTSDDAPAFRRELADMHRLRYRVFHERLGWDVAVHGDQERDTFDALPGTSCLLYHDAFGRLRGCARLLKTTGPTMLRDVFQELLAGAPAPSAPTIICVDWPAGANLGADLNRRRSSFASTMADLR